jgi:hypothetical protein
MHVKRVTQIPGLDTRIAGVTITHKTPRAQPEGLKARYQPIGVSGASGNIAKANRLAGSRGAEILQETATQLTPKADSVSTKKRKAGAGDDIVLAPTSPDLSSAPNSRESTEPVPKKAKRSHKSKLGSSIPMGDEGECQVTTDLVDREDMALDINQGAVAKSAKSKSKKKEKKGLDNDANVNERQDLLMMTPDPKKQKGKRKHSSEDEAEAAKAQLHKETLSAEKKSKKPKLKTPSGVAPIKKETKILPPAVIKPSLAANQSENGTTRTHSKSSQDKEASSSKSKIKKQSYKKEEPENTINGSSVKKETPVPVPPHLRQSTKGAATSSTADEAIDTPSRTVEEDVTAKKEGKRKKKDKGHKKEKDKTTKEKSKEKEKSSASSHLPAPTEASRKPKVSPIPLPKFGGKK